MLLLSLLSSRVIVLEIKKQNFGGRFLRLFDVFSRVEWWKHSINEFWCYWESFGIYAPILLWYDAEETLHFGCVRASLSPVLICWKLTLLFLTHLQINLVRGCGCNCALPVKFLTRLRKFKIFQHDEISNRGNSFSGVKEAYVQSNIIRRRKKEFDLYYLWPQFHINAGCPSLRAVKVDGETKQGAHYAFRDTVMQMLTMMVIRSGQLSCKANFELLPATERGEWASPNMQMAKVLQCWCLFIHTNGIHLQTRSKLKEGTVDFFDLSSTRFPSKSPWWRVWQ